MLGNRQGGGAEGVILKGQNRYTCSDGTVLTLMVVT